MSSKFQMKYVFRFVFFSSFQSIFLCVRQFCRKRHDESYHLAWTNRSERLNRNNNSNNKKKTERREILHTAVVSAQLVGFKIWERVFILINVTEKCLPHEVKESCNMPILTANRKNEDFLKSELQKKKAFFFLVRLQLCYDDNKRAWSQWSKMKLFSRKKI